MELHKFNEDEYEKQKQQSQGQGNGKGQQGQGQAGQKGQKGQQNQYGQNGNSSRTVSAMEEMQKQLIDKNCTTPGYINLPSNIDYNHFVVGYKEVHKNMRSHYSSTKRSIDEYALAHESLGAFKRHNKKIINNLVSLFEMKKRASLSVKSKTAKTGEIDTVKMHSYKFNDDIFKRITSTPKGKSHGLVMFLDCSGSMSSNFTGAIEQILNLVMFCRKISIPFEVYGFNDHYQSDGDASDAFEKTNECVTFYGNFQLRQYFHSSMRQNEFNDACLNMMALANAYRYQGSYRQEDYSKYGQCTIPREENLGGTPLDEAVISSIYLVQDMKKKHALDICNVIYIPSDLH
jgi:hypothetical protein